MADGDEMLIYTDMGCAPRPRGDIGLYLAEASMTMAGWVVLAAGGELHLHLMPGAAVPLSAGPEGDRLWELARSLTCSADGLPLRASVAVAEGPPLDVAGAITPLRGRPSALAHSLATAAVPLIEPGPEAAWDRLAPAARQAQAWVKDGTLLGAALAWKGRGRLVGPLRGDPLIRFGVSVWR
ncbi:MAG: hypothetical protein IT548_17765 [Alphaproteobacteria bacterium]|nr:hypothetical protein [Alphaproteobacteria bacterium]